MSRLQLCAALLLCMGISAAQTPKASPKRPLQEFPLRMQQSIEAGKTTVGTQVEAKLVIATLVRGVVIPATAVFYGTVEESLAKTKDAPSRLKIHVTRARWGSHSVSLDLYLVNSLYQYPKTEAAEPDPFPDHARTTGDPVIDSMTRNVRSESRQKPEDGRSKYYVYPKKVVMEDVDLKRDPAGVSLTSTKLNLRLYHDVIYSFEGSATGEQPAEHIAE